MGFFKEPPRREELLPTTTFITTNTRTLVRKGKMRMIIIAAFMFLAVTVNVINATPLGSIGPIYAEKAKKMAAEQQQTLQEGKKNLGKSCWKSCRRLDGYCSHCGA